MMYRDSGYVEPDTINCKDIPYAPWPYVRTSGRLVGSWQVVIWDPMTLPDVVPVFSPVSDSVIIRIKDNDTNHVEHECRTPVFSVKP